MMVSRKDEFLVFYISFIFPRHL